MNEKSVSRLRDAVITAVIVAVATAVCFIVRAVTDSGIPIPLIFVLAVLVVSRFTDGFLYGILTSVFAIFIINYAFTYPFFAFNFTISGYPFTFISLFAVSVITSALTTQIKQQQKIHAEAEREKLYADFMRAISHDLRTPLTTIVGSTSAILDSEIELQEDQKRMLLYEIRDDAAWLIRMVENILSVTRIRGETNILKMPEPLEEVVGEVVGKFRKRYPDKTIRVFIPDELIFIPMDVTLIEQVLTNLLENAALHGTGMTRIDFSVKIEDEAVFSVENDGDVIDTTAFQKFIGGYYFKPERLGRSEDRSSLGIGLSVCASIVKAHGGELFMRSNAGGGVLSGFTLPMREDADHGFQR